MKRISIVLVVALALLVAFFASLYLIASNSEPYEAATEFVSESPELQAQLGDIMKTRLAILGYTVSYEGPVGKADFEMLVEGEKTNGSVFVSLNRKAGKWNVSHASRALVDGRLFELPP